MVNFYIIKYVHKVFQRDQGNSKAWIVYSVRYKFFHWQFLVTYHNFMRNKNTNLFMHLIMWQEKKMTSSEFYKNSTKFYKNLYKNLY